MEHKIKWQRCFLPVEFYLTTAQNDCRVLSEVDAGSEKLYVRMNIVCRRQTKELNMDIYIWTKAKDAVDGVQCGDITARGKCAFRNVKPNEILRLEAEFPLDKGVKKDCILHLEFMGSDIFLFPFKLGSTSMEIPDFNRDAKIAKYLLLNANDSEWANPDKYELESMKKIREMFVPEELTDFLERQLRLHTFDKHHNAYNEKKSPRTNYNKHHDAYNKKKSTRTNYNAAFYGNSGTGKSTVVQLYADFLHETGMFGSHEIYFYEGRDLFEERATTNDAKIPEAFRRAANHILHINNPNEMMKRESDWRVNSPENVLEMLTNEAKNRNVILILTGAYAEITEMLSSSEQLGRLIPNRFHFADLTSGILMNIAGKMLDDIYFSLSDDAHATLKDIVVAARNNSGKHFRNAEWLKDLITETVSNAKNRIVQQDLLADYSCNHLILPEDIPQKQSKSTGKAMDKLNRMIGLNNLKQTITEYLNGVWINQKRRQQGLFSQTGPLHMIFTGNPGTGKTTVADFIGEIYHNMGILSSGHVVSLDRSTLIGRYIGETEANTRLAIKRAQGGVMFIDEAYSLFNGNGIHSKDYGGRVIDTLMPVLSRDDADLIVIMAGYPAEMEMLLDSNSGLRSRFPHTFHFVDYAVEELMQIADSAAKERDLAFSPEARKALEQLVGKAYADRDAHFGNARYIVRLLQTKIIPKMGARLAKHEGELDEITLKTILPEDIPSTHRETKPADRAVFDEERINEALKRLDGMVGMTMVKTAVHNFVKTARMLNRQGKSVVGKTPLKWSFTGNTGTGKSTVAGIFAEILHAMKILERGQIVEVNAEEIYGVSAWQAEERLKTAMHRSQHGLLFIDSDAPMFKQRSDVLDSEQLRIKLAGLTTDMPGSYALVIAEHESPRQQLVKSLVGNGISEFDNTFVFTDYSEDELFQILEQMLAKEDLTMDSESAPVMKLYIAGICTDREAGYANARTMRMLAASIIQNARLRTAEAEEPVKTVTGDDVKAFVWKDLSQRRKPIGFSSKS